MKKLLLLFLSLAIFTCTSCSTDDSAQSCTKPLLETTMTCTTDEISQIAEQTSIVETEPQITSTSLTTTKFVSTVPKEEEMISETIGSSCNEVVQKDAESEENLNFLKRQQYLLSNLDKTKLDLVTSFSTLYSLEETYETKGFNIDLCAHEVTTVIPNGYNFNWFEIVGNTGKDEGYKVANTFLNGKVVPGYGGGVCQVASTIYNCVLQMDMKVIERHAHGLPVSYVDWYNEKDATVGDIGGPNLIFNNNLGYDIYIKAYVSTVPDNEIKYQGMLTVEFYRIIL